MAGIGRLGIIAGLLLSVLFVSGILAYNGTFYPTGAQYYEACWEMHSASAPFARASNPYQAILWANCDPIAKRGLFGAGMVFADGDINNTNEDAVILNAVCPGPPGRYLYPVVLLEIQTSGGPTILDKMAPAAWMVDRVLNAHWPKCNAERQRQGYPKIVEVTPGDFNWDQSCNRCVHASPRYLSSPTVLHGPEACQQRAEERWQRVQPAQIDIGEHSVTLASDNRYHLSASLRNKSKLLVDFVALDITAYDCPVAPTSISIDKCNVMGHRFITFHKSFPAGEIGELWGDIKVNELVPGFGGFMPKLRGFLSWTLLVAGVRALTENERDEKTFNPDNVALRWGLEPC